MSEPVFLTKLLDGASVDWKPLGDLCSVFSGFAFSSKHFNTVNEGLPLIRIRDVNSGYSGTYYSGEYDQRFLVNNGDILIGMDGDFRAIQWQHGSALLNQRVCRLQDFAAEINPVFLFYLIQDELDRIHSSIEGATVKHLSSRELKKSQIPVPPVEIQAEIVRILDSFTKLTTELTTELKSRKQQYNYHRDHLLGFEGRDVEWKTLDDIGEFIRGKRFTKADYVDEGIDVIHYGEIYTRYGVYASQTFSQVRKSLEDSLKYAEPGDVILTDVGETVEEVGKALAWLGETKVAIHDHCYAFRHNLNAKYVAYCMQASSFITKKSKYVARTKVNTLLIKAFGEAEIPVPYPNDPEKSLAEQARIVAILDKFNTLTTSLSDGLPREIELRQQQYEYYRDMLLSFPKPTDDAGRPHK